MIKRIFSTILLWTIVAASLVYGGIRGGITLLTILSILAQYEFYTLLEKCSCKPCKILGISGGTLLMLSAMLSGVRIGGICSTLLISVGFVVLMSIFFVIRFTPKDILTVFVPTVFGFFYIPLMLAIPIEWMKVSQMVSGYHFPIICLLWLIVVAKFSDVGGLLVGSYCGKHKISPHFSPKKSWEGLIGSLFFSVGAGALVRFVLGVRWPSVFSWKWMIVISMITAIIALVSDLIESGFKRLSGEKDSGGIIPGIGGVLDLLDSLLFSLPLGVVLIQLFI